MSTDAHLKSHCSVSDVSKFSILRNENAKNNREYAFHDTDIMLKMSNLNVYLGKCVLLRRRMDHVT